MWGESLTTEDDVFDVFERFVRGYVPSLPWCDRMEKESAAGGLLKPLATLNHHGFLTINSQPRVNAAPSEDASFGWGPAGGTVYQKAYLEFFCSPSNLERLLALLQSSQEHASITLQAFNAAGEHRAHRCQHAFSEVGSSAPPDARDRHVMCVAVLPPLSSSCAPATPFCAAAPCALSQQAGRRERARSAGARERFRVECLLGT
jgi:hypothetical protein